MGTVTFLFLDEPGSDDAGSSRGGVLAGDVLDAVRARISAWGGQELDLTVDGLGVVFRSASAAVASARAMQLAVRTLNGGGAGALRVGVHTGEPLAIPGGRYFGAAVWLAARLHKRAAPGQILVSDTVFELLDAPGRARCTPVGSLDLKGLSDRVVAFDASWADAGTHDDVDVARLRTVTLMTVDQVGSTAQIDMLGDESARAIHAALLDVLREAIGEHAGHEVEYTGDGLTAMFDAALDATGCAVAMQQAAYRHRLRYPSEQGLALRVGIQSAEAVETERDSWTGTAQQCAALCTAAGNGEIVVSRLVRAITAPRRVHVFEPFDGADAPAGVDGARFVLRWEPELSEFSLPADLMAKRGQFGFVGRRAELERLVRLWADARAGEPRVVLLSGAAGIGKSSIAAQFAEAARENASTIVLYGGCRSGAPTDYEPFADALAQYVAATSRADLRRQLGVHAQVLASVIPGLGARLPDGPGRDAVAGDAEVSAVGRAVEAFVAAIAQTAPVLLVIDDLHNASSSTLRVLREVATTAGSVALMVVGLFRSPAAGRSPVLDALGVDPERRDQTEHLVIEGLPDDDVAALVEAVTRVAPSALARDTIAAQSNGVPRAVVELARSQMEQGVSSDLRRAIEVSDQARLDRRGLREEIARGVLEIQRLRRPLAALPEIAGGNVDRDGTPPAPGPCPYRGLESFRADDAEWFFGREQLVAELVAHVAGSRLVGVIGASGSGKSSLVRAGLVPALGAGILPGAERWLSLVMTPTARPRQALALACAATGRISGEAARDLLEGGDLALLVEQLVRPDEQVVLVVDQCEELFTAAPEEERERFVDMMVAAAADGGVPVTIVLVLRADFYGACAQYPGLADQLEDSQVLVGAMTADEVRRTIELPARRAGLVLEGGFVEAVIADVSGEPGGLPLLSTALLETWERRRGRSLTLAAYAETGGVRSAVARLADSVYDAMDPDERDVARRMLLRLARPGGEDTVGDVRRRAQLSELVADDPAAQHVLDRLVERRLVTTDEHTAEVAHEAVLREWPQLREWLDDDREGRRIHHQLADATHEWESANRDSEHLYRGARLAAAVDYATMHAADLNPVEHEFLTAGRARATAELAASQRSARRFRRLTAGLAGILVIALAAGSFALIQRNRANQDAATASRNAALATESASDAISRGLASEATQLVADYRVDPALLLGIESSAFESKSVAGHNADGLEGVGSLLNTLDAESSAEGFLYGLSSPASLIAYSPDGDLVAAVSTDGTVRVWDAKNRELLQHQPAPLRLAAGEFVTSLSINRRHVLVTGTQLGSVRLWDLEKHEPWPWQPAQPPRHAPTFSFVSPQTAIAYTGATLSDHDVLALVSAKSPVSPSFVLTFWNIDTGRRVGSTTQSSAAQLASSFSPDGRLFALGVALGNTQLGVQVFDAATGQLVRTLEGQRVTTPGIVATDFSPDGTRVMLVTSASSDGALATWDLATGRRTESGPTEAAVSVVGVSHVGRELVTTDVASGTTSVIDTTTGAPLVVDLPAAAATTTSGSVAFDPTDHTLAIAAPDGAIELSSLSASAATSALTRRAVVPALGDKVPWDTLSPSGHYAVRSDGHSVRVVDTATGRPAPRVPFAISTYAFGADDTMALSTSGGIVIWDVSRGRVLRRLVGPGAHCPGGRGGSDVIAYQGEAGNGRVALDCSGLSVWRLHGTKSKLEWRLGLTHIGSPPVFSADGSTLAFNPAQPDGDVADIYDAPPIQIDNADSGRRVAVIANASVHFALSPDGRVLAAIRSSGSLALFDTRTGSLARTLIAKTPVDAYGPVLPSGIAFSPDGATLVGLTADQTLDVWDATTGTFILTLHPRQPNRSPNSSIDPDRFSFSADSKDLELLVANANRSSTVITFTLSPAAAACRLVGRNLTHQEWATFVGRGVPYQRTCPQWPAGT